MPAMSQNAKRVAQVLALKARAAEFGMPAVGLSDHRSMAGAIKLYRASPKSTASRRFSAAGLHRTTAAPRRSGTATSRFSADNTWGGNLIGP